MYECEICHGINHAAKLHCSFCGTIPAKYSILAVPAVEKDDEFFSYIRVLVAWGADRQACDRTAKKYFRTVPMDYYAESEA